MPVTSLMNKPVGSLAGLAQACASCIFQISGRSAFACSPQSLFPDKSQGCIRVKFVLRIIRSRQPRKFIFTETMVQNGKRIRDPLFQG